MEWHTCSLFWVLLLSNSMKPKKCILLFPGATQQLSLCSGRKDTLSWDQRAQFWSLNELSQGLLRIRYSESRTILVMEPCSWRYIHRVHGRARCTSKKGARGLQQYIAQFRLHMALYPASLKEPRNPWVQLQGHTSALTRKDACTYSGLHCCSQGELPTERPLGKVDVSR